MKTLFATVAIALAVWGGAGAQSLDREISVLASTRSNLKNIATALEMWAADHHGLYPPTLEPLEVNYLKKIPLQVDGSNGWNYRAEGAHFCLSDSWEGFRRLGLPSELSYDSDKGLAASPLPQEMALFGERVQMKGRWLGWRGDSGLSASWERFGTRISARLRGPETIFESFEQQVTRLRDAYPRWGWKTDQGGLADRLVQVGTNGWTVVGLYHPAGEPWRRVLLVTKGERLLEVTVEDHESKDPLGRLADLHLLLAQI